MIGQSRSTFYQLYLQRKAGRAEGNVVDAELHNNEGDHPVATKCQMLPAKRSVEFRRRAFQPVDFCSLKCLQNSPVQHNTAQNVHGNEFFNQLNDQASSFMYQMIIITQL